MRNPLLSSRKFEALAQNSLEPSEQLIWAGEESPASRYFKIAVAFIIGIVVMLPIFLGLFGSILHKSFAPIYVIGFFYPVVAKDQARIRVQISAAHSKGHLDKAIAAFTKVGKELGVIK